MSLFISNTMENTDDIYYHKYLKYKIKYLDLLFKKNKVDISDNEDDESNLNGLKIKKKPTKNINLSHMNKNELEINSNRTVDTIETVDTIYSIDEYNSLELLNHEQNLKINNIKEKLNIDEYFYLINLILKKNKPTEHHDFDSNEVLWENILLKLNKDDKTFIKSLTSDQLIMIKNNSCKTEIKNKIIDLIDVKSECIDIETFDLLAKNIVILEEEFKCKLDENDTNLFINHIYKKKCN